MNCIPASGVDVGDSFTIPTAVIAPPSVELERGRFWEKKPTNRQQLENPELQRRLPPQFHVFDLLQPKDVRKLNALLENSGEANGILVTHAPEYVVGTRLIKVVVTQQVEYLTDTRIKSHGTPSTPTQQRSKHQSKVPSRHAAGSGNPGRRRGSRDKPVAAKKCAD